MSDHHEMAAVILERLRDVIHSDTDFVTLHEPCFIGKEWSYVKECLDTGWVSSVGAFVDRFESDIADYTGVRHVVAVVNGTAALHMCLMLCGVKAGDEVIIPALTFVATANAVTYCGAVLHFVDSTEDTLGLDPGKLADYLADIAEIRSGHCINRQSGRPIRAVMPMHTFGHAVDLDPLAEVCARFNIALIEDAAESLGSFYKGRHTGNVGRVAALSFNGNKVITTGGGGAILTNNDELGRMAKHLTTTAKVPHRWAYNHDMVGYNYRMPNMNAALGCAQLEQLPHFLRQKRRLAERYTTAFEDVSGVSFITEPVFGRSNYWLNTLLLDEKYAGARDAILDKTNDAGIMTRPVWTLMHRLPMFVDAPRMDLTTAESLERRLINIPSSAVLGGT